MSFGAALGAVFVGLVAGLVVLAWVHGSRDARRPYRPRRAVSAEASAPSAVAAASPPSANAAVVEETRSNVVFRIPAGARVFVEGHALAEPRVVRPKSGTIKAIVKAEGRHERLVEVTASSPDEIEVTLVAKNKPKAAEPAARPTSTITMPPNPYE